MATTDNANINTSYGSNKYFLWESTAGLADWDVQFPKTPNNELILIGAELIQKPNAHDVLILQFKGKPILDTTVIVAGDPVVFTWTSGPNVSKWNGYVYELDPVTTTQAHNTTITCIAASYVLKNTDQQIYKNVTADAVVSKIAQKNNMQAIVERHPRVRESIVQAGQSYWQLLRRLANQTGFALRAENTTIYFMSKDKIYTSKKDSAPYFKYNDGVTKAQRMYGTCFKFTPEISDENPDLSIKVDRVITGTVSATGATIETTHAALDHSNPVQGSMSPSEDYFLGNI